MAFPCRQFGGQELRTDADIRAFVDKYGVRFSVFAPVDVNGLDAHPVFKILNPESSIGWNFDGKFLVDQSGKLVKRYSSRTSVAVIEADVRALLAGA